MEGAGAEVRRGPPDISSLFSVKVDNISYDTTKGEIEKFFSVRW